VVVGDTYSTSQREAQFGPDSPPGVRRESRGINKGPSAGQVVSNPTSVGGLSEVESLEYKEGRKLTVCNAGSCQTARTLYQHPLHSRCIH